MEYRKPVLVAEIGCNHKGDLEIAEEMSRIAIEFCGADIVKFQKRSPKDLLTEEEYNAPHPVPRNSYGDTYGEHREFLEFGLTEHLQLKEYIESLGGEYSVSVWDWRSAEEVCNIVRPDHIKIPSALATHSELIGYIAEELPDATIHISMGMTTVEERNHILRDALKDGYYGRTVFYHCTSSYPAKFEDMHLLSIGDINQNVIRGFSGHHKGIAIDIAAFTLGATYIERHFTLDRTWKGTDHAASLEPGGLRKLKRDLLATYKSLTYRPPSILDEEKPHAKKLRWDRHQD